MRVFYAKKQLILLALLGLVFFSGYLAGRFSNQEWAVTSRANREMPIFFVKKSDREVCLTFDISWGEKTLPLVLQILNAQQTPATFFLSGPWAVRHPEEMKAITAGGHEIASHGDRHVNLSEYSKAQVAENISKAQQDLLTVTPKVAPFFRPPNGDYDDLVIDTARELGYETVIWAVDSLDWKNPGADYMIERVLKKTFPGAIILCHASDSSKQIHLALNQIIQGLRAKGYKLVTLSQLMADGTAMRTDPR